MDFAQESWDAMTSEAMLDGGLARLSGNDPVPLQY
ncbi:hypothetical protein SBBP2_230022 [Burkholderiales bacterium]|nr:hypothetical protein SBBP2_230022 [Burkholderiales bacterium]